MAFDKRAGKDKKPSKVVSIAMARKGITQEKSRRGGRLASNASDAERFMNTLREKVELSSDALKEIPLTVEESVFVHALSEGDSMVNAYMKAFPLETVTVKEATSRARTLSMRPNVAVNLVELVDANRLWEGHTGKRMRLFIARQLEEIAASSANDATRVAALRELGKLSHVRAYEEETKGEEEEQTPAEIMAEIEARLSKMAK